MKNSRLVFFTFFSLFFFVSLLFPEIVLGQVFTLSPPSSTQSTGSEFTVDLLIDTAGKVVSGADVKFSFDVGVMEAIDIIGGSFFPEVSHNIYSGTIYISGVFTDESEYKSGAGKLATLTLKGKTAGTSSLSFVCTNQGTDTNIWDNSEPSINIVKCSSLGNASYTFTEGSSTSPTPTMSAAGLGGDTGVTSTLTPTPTPELPVTGISLPTLFSVGFGLALVIFGVAFLF